MPHGWGKTLDAQGRAFGAWKGGNQQRAGARTLGIQSHLQSYDDEH